MKNSQAIISLLLPIVFTLTACGSSGGQSQQNNENPASSVSSIFVAQSSLNNSQSSSVLSSSNSSRMNTASISSLTNSSLSSSGLSTTSSKSSSSKSNLSTSSSSSAASFVNSSSNTSSSNKSSTSSQSTSSVRSSASSSQTSSQISGCGKSFMSGDIKGLVVKDGAGRDRSFNINISPDYTGNLAASVIFNFHGRSGTSEESASTGFQYAVAEMHDQAISVFPQGIMWQNYAVGWEESCGGYDMVFFDNMLNYLKNNYCINPDKVFVTGMSWGGDMVNALACCRGDKIKSVAPISGPELINASCPTNKWPIIWMRYGTSDGAYSQELFESTRQFYIQKLGCSTNSTALPDDSQCVTYSGCKTPLTVCARPLQHVPLGYPEVQQLWQYWRSLP